MAEFTEPLSPGRDSRPFLDEGSYIESSRPDYAPAFGRNVPKSALFHLASLPVDLFLNVSKLLPAQDLFALWCTGDRYLLSLMSSYGGVQDLDMRFFYSRPVGLPAFPSFFKKLVNLKIRHQGEWQRVIQRIYPSCDIKNWPSSLERIELFCQDPIRFFYKQDQLAKTYELEDLDYPAQAMAQRRWRVSDATVSSLDPSTYFYDLNTLFPHLTTLDLSATYFKIYKSEQNLHKVEPFLRNNDLIAQRNSGGSPHSSLDPSNEAYLDEEYDPFIVSEIAFFRSLPSSLTCLKIDLPHFFLYESLVHLPSSVTDLTIQSLKPLPTYPPSKAVPRMPASLKMLKITGSVDSIVLLSVLPPTLISLAICDDNDFPNWITPLLPPSLTHFELHCTTIENVFSWVSILSKTLTSLVLRGSELRSEEMASIDDETSIMAQWRRAWPPSLKRLQIETNLGVELFLQMVSPLPLEALCLNSTDARDVITKEMTTLIPETMRELVISGARISVDIGAWEKLPRTVTKLELRNSLIWHDYPFMDLGTLPEALTDIALEFRHKGSTPVSWPSGLRSLRLLVRHSSLDSSTDRDEKFMTLLRSSNTQRPVANISELCGKNTPNSSPMTISDADYFRSLPSTLTTLKLEGEIPSYVPHFIPRGLSKLVLSWFGFRRPVEKPPVIPVGALPSSLTILKINSCTMDPIEWGKLPRSLTQLRMEGGFREPMEIQLPDRIRAVRRLPRLTILIVLNAWGWNEQVEANLPSTLHKVELVGRYDC